eukprot:TRINITY_DN77472_c0_g1_i1.p1 TRINITY_DN77472_c0_g1~~TRINITY_DN77472_c0_g1_i1.p1  ORF type:complete len:333 (-),score=67.84 TRINITY_DN77472_c0_g1_i1:89-1087(-)
MARLGQLLALEHARPLHDVDAASSDCAHGLPSINADAMDGLVFVAEFPAHALRRNFHAQNFLGVDDLFSSYGQPLAGRLHGRHHQAAEPWSSPLGSRRHHAGHHRRSLHLGRHGRHGYPQMPLYEQGWNLGSGIESFRSGVRHSIDRLGDWFSGGLGTSSSSSAEADGDASGDAANADDVEDGDSSPSAPSIFSRSGAEGSDDAAEASLRPEAAARRHLQASGQMVMTRTLCKDGRCRMVTMTRRMPVLDIPVGPLRGDGVMDEDPTAALRLPSDDDFLASVSSKAAAPKESPVELLGGWPALQKGAARQVSAGAFRQHFPGQFNGQQDSFW